MIREWRDVIRETDPYEPADMEGAVYRLVTEQALYETNARQRTAYRIVKEYEREVRQICALLGVDIYVSPDHSYCAARPMRGGTLKLGIEPTLMALVLRKVYHLARQQGEDVDGHVYVTLSELELVYQDSTGRSFPNQPRQVLVDLMTTMRSFGIARRHEADPTDGQPFAVEILPAIEFLLDETAIADLESHATRAERDQSQTLPDEPQPRHDSDDGNSECEGAVDENA